MDITEAQYFDAIEASEKNAGWTFTRKEIEDIAVEALRVARLFTAGDILEKREIFGEQER